MDTALKILNENRRALKSIIKKNHEKLAFAEFTKNERDIKMYLGFIKNNSAKLAEVDKAIEEIESLRTIAA